jgi:hypothetical protein
MSKDEVPKVMRVIDVKEDTCHQIQNSREKQRRKRSKDPKEISIIDQGGNLRTIHLVEEAKVLKREHSH